MKRQFKDITIGLSVKNEPESNIIIGNVSLRRYPDMKSAYQKMSKLFNISQGQIILGNGCENVLKNVLLALKPTKLYWSTPAWSFLDVYCQQLSMQKENSAFAVSPSMQVSERYAQIEGDYVYYNTVGANNLIHTAICSQLADAASAKILDISYLPLSQAIEAAREAVNGKKSVVVGSFDKSYGAALRLGYAVFSEDLSDAIRMQAEAYINMAAAKFIDEEMFLQQPSCYYYNQVISLCNDIKLKTMSTRCYVTILGNIDTSIPCKKFIADGLQFTRFGIPSSDSEFQELKKVFLKTQAFAS